MSLILDAAFRLSQECGFSVVPIAGHDWTMRVVDDRTSREVEVPLRKKPAFMNGHGPKPFKWKHLQESIMPPDQVRRYFGKSPNVAVVFGAVSGFAECVDFDEAGFYEAWRDLLVENGHDELVAKLFVQSTQTPGHYQVIYRCPEGVEHNQKLALRPATEEELSKDPRRKAVEIIETRGEGGYALVAPSEGYAVVQGDLAALPILSSTERRVLLDAAAYFDSMPPEETSAPRPGAGSRPSGERPSGLTPGDDFDLRGDWAEILEPHGWRAVRGCGRLTAWARPGKEGVHTSAHTGLGHHGIDFLVVFTTNGWPLQPRPMKYGKFRAYCVLNHGGDDAARQSSAAKELYAKGYGERMDGKSRAADERRAKAPASGSVESEASKTRENQTHDHSPAGASDQEGEEESLPDGETASGFWASRTMDIDQLMSMPDKPMLVEGLIGKQDRWMWVGAPGSGKTFGILHFLVVCALGGEFAYQFDVPTPLRVAYCTSEGRFGLKRRIAAVLSQFGATFEDVRPYMKFVADVPQFHKPEGERGIWAFAESLEGSGFVPDILAIDTLSKATLGSKEVDNGEAALICDLAARIGERLDCSTLFAHHSGWDQDRPRGASAYFGDMDVILLQKLNQETRQGEIAYFKGKEIEPFPAIKFELRGSPEHKTAIMDFGPSNPERAEMGALGQILLAMANHPGQEWWSATELVKACGGASSRSAIGNVLYRKSLVTEGGEKLFEWDGKDNPKRYRRIL